MIYDIYLGAVGTIILLNLAQWSLFRDRIYGLFTLQTLLWFTHAFLLSMSLSDRLQLIAYTTINGLVIVCYLGLIHHLFAGQSSGKQIWYRWVQLGIVLYLLMETTLLLTGTRWQGILVQEYLSLSYWLVLTGCCIAGIRMAARQGDAVGRFFLVGSLLLFLNEARTVVYAFCAILDIDTYPSRSEQEYVGQFVAGGFIIELLCFSLSLVFRQRQLAVAQAVRQTRTEEQLIQQQLQAELIQRRLEQEKTDVQIRALQAQVNPHFLFNSLNSLSSLISEDPAQAEHFVDKLSNVYRYVLRANEQPLITVAEELSFIDAYYHLLKTRYGTGLDLNVAVGDSYQYCQIPPLTLQLLVENAVKHNVVSAKHPLRIWIRATDGAELTVSNTLQKKQSRVLSNGVGLSNIVAKYQMLNLPAPSVDQTDGKFTVALPLMN